MSSDFQPTVRRRKRQSERAQGTLEFALIFPFFIVLLLGIIDFAWALRSYVTVTNAVREGARYCVTCQYDDNTSPEGIKQRVVRYSRGLLETPEVTVGETSPSIPNPCGSAGPSSYPNPPPTDAKVIVKATYTYKWITPLGGILTFATGGVLPSQLTLSSTSSMRFE